MRPESLQEAGEWLSRAQRDLLVAEQVLHGPSPLLDIEWLESLAMGEQVERELDFIEPNLRFHVEGQTRDRTLLRVFFEVESRPSWAPADGAGMNDLWADLQCAPDELRAWTNDLRQQLSRFPPRARP